MQCPKGSWCPGGSSTAALSTSCGAFLTTVSTGAVSPASCITQPGAAYMSGAGTAVACKPGSYNEGGNQRNCTPCSVGMSTAAAGANCRSKCTAQPGWFYQVRRLRRKHAVQQDMALFAGYCLAAAQPTHVAQHNCALRMHAGHVGDKQLHVEIIHHEATILLGCSAG